MGPSTVSMVPRMRTGGGCWAHATEANTDITVSEATSARGIHEEIFGMVIPSRLIDESKEYLAKVAVIPG
jgi:hypothetical protein